MPTPVPPPSEWANEEQLQYLGYLKRRHEARSDAPRLDMEEVVVRHKALGRRLRRVTPEALLQRQQLAEELFLSASDVVAGV